MKKKGQMWGHPSTAIGSYAKKGILFSSISSTVLIYESMPLPTREIRFVPNITRQPHAVELRAPWPPRVCAQTDFDALRMDTTGGVEPSRGWDYALGPSKTPWGWGGESVRRTQRVSNRERWLITHVLFYTALTDPLPQVFADAISEYVAAHTAC